MSVHLLAPVPAHADVGMRTDDTRDEAERVAVPPELRWEPHWQNRGDCGPVSVYVLMRLLGRETTIEEVKMSIPYDPIRGCSLETLSRGAKRLGFAAEVRFVDPSDLRKMEGPFIVHTLGSLQHPTGHFRVVIGYSEELRAFTTIDVSSPELETVPEDAIVPDCSGYILVPKNRTYLPVLLDGLSVGSAIVLVGLIARSFSSALGGKHTVGLRADP